MKIATCRCTAHIIMCSTFLLLAACQKQGSAPRISESIRYTLPIDKVSFGLAAHSASGDTLFWVNSDTLYLARFSSNKIIDKYKLTMRELKQMAAGANSSILFLYDNRVERFDYDNIELTSIVLPDSLTGEIQSTFLADYGNKLYIPVYTKDIRLENFHHKLVDCFYDYKKEKFETIKTIFPSRIFRQQFYFEYPYRLITKKGELVYSVPALPDLLILSGGKRRELIDKQFKMPRPFSIDSMADFSYIRKFETENKEFGPLGYWPEKGLYFRRMCIGGVFNRNGRIRTLKDRTFEVLFYDDAFKLVGRKSYAHPYDAHLVVINGELKIPYYLDDERTTYNLVNVPAPAGPQGNGANASGAAGK
jgi:hypothetical protein